jgi:hypothetical protein
VTVDGELYQPHEGERVKISGSSSVGELQSFWSFNRLARMPAEDRPSEDAPVEEIRAYNDGVTERLSEGFDDLCSAIAQRVADWDWTDDEGRLLPKPDGTSGPLKRLRDEELYYLRDVIQGETAAQRKNGSKPSPTTSPVRAASRSKRG